MTWVATAVAVGTAIYSNQQGKKAASKGAAAQQQASNSAIAEQRRQHDQTRADQAPWMQAGGWALGQQQNYLNGDRSGFENSPDYAYALEQGLGAIDGRAAARGGLFGGGNTRDAIKFGSGLASMNADNYYSKLTGMSNSGSQTAQGLGALGANMANQIGGQYNNTGNARQSMYQQNGYNNAAMATNLGSAFNGWYQQRQMNNTPGYTPAGGTRSYVGPR